MRTGMLLVVLAMLAAAPALADCSPDSTYVGVPDLSLSTVTVGYGGVATLLVVPDGSGAPFTAARGPGGAIVDATITLTLLDYCGPIANFSRADMWLEGVGTAFAACSGGTLADTNTDANGRTSWVLPLRAGGHEASSLQVVVNGSPLWQVPPLNLRAVSPDLNGDRAISLADVPLFAHAFYGAYAFRADLHADGVINLSDIPVLAHAMGAHCP